MTVLAYSIVYTSEREGNHEHLWRGQRRSMEIGLHAKQYNNVCKGETEPAAFDF